MRVQFSLMTSLIAAGIAIGPSATVAQNSAPGIQVLPVPGTHMPRGFDAGKIAYTIDRAMPYSGIWVTRHVTTFPDGEIQRDRSTRKVWRDSEGRTREDTTWTRKSGAVATVSHIDDPVAKVRYIWRIEPGRKTVVTETHFSFEDYSVTEIWPNSPSHPVEEHPGVTIVILSPAATRLNPNPNEQKLGPTYKNGVYAEGVRTVEPFPSDPNHHRVEETWQAPDLNIFIKCYLDTGDGFIEDSELKNIDRAEPDPSTFVPPPGLPKHRAPASDPAWKESYGAD
jgi:hypothetical protein